MDHKSTAFPCMKFDLKSELSEISLHTKFHAEKSSTSYNLSVNLDHNDGLLPRFYSKLPKIIPEDSFECLS